MHGQSHVQVKQSLQQKGATKADVMLNSAYNIKQTNRKNQQVKGNQHISKKMLQGGSFPNSLNQTQSVRFNPGSAVPNIQNYNTSGQISNSINQSGMTSTTQPNAHLIFAEGQQQFVSTATIPMIKNGDVQIDQMKNAYSNTQMLDRLFNNGSGNANQPPQTTHVTGTQRKRSSKGSLAASTAALSKAPVHTNSDFMPSSATSATAFYAASKQAQQNLQSNSS